MAKKPSVGCRVFHQFIGRLHEERSRPNLPAVCELCAALSPQTRAACFSSFRPCFVTRSGCVHVHHHRGRLRQPWVTIRSALRLKVEAARRPCAGYRKYGPEGATPSLAVTTRMFIWLTLIPSGRSASSYRPVIARFRFDAPQSIHRRYVQRPLENHQGSYGSDLNNTVPR